MIGFIAKSFASLSASASTTKQGGRVVVWAGGKGAGTKLWKAVAGVLGVGTGGFVIGRNSDSIIKKIKRKLQ